MANRFWVGGTNTWDNSTTSNWSTTDGGGGGASVPGSSDTALFTANSGSVTVTLNYNPTLTGLNFTGFTGTFTDSAHTITTGALTVVSGMTLNHTGQFTLTGNAAPALSNKSYNTISATAYTAGVTWTGASGLNINTLTIANSSGYIGIVVPAMTINTALTVTGVNNNSGRMAFGALDFFTPKTITVNGTFSFTNIDFYGATAAGSAGTWSGTSIGNAGNNSNITFTSPKTVYYVQAVASSDFLTSNLFATSTGGATSSANFPLPQDTCIFDNNSFSGAGQTVTCATNNVRFPALDFSTVTNSPLFTPANPSYCGSVILSASMTYTPSGSTNFRSLGGGITNTITSSGNSFLTPTIMYKSADIFSQSDDFKSSQNITFNIGTWSTNGHNVTGNSIQSTGGSIRAINMGTSSTWQMNGSGSSWNFNGASGVTLNANTSTIKFSANSSSSSNFFGNAKTYYNFWNNTTGTGVCIVNDSNTFNDFKIDSARTQQFVAATNTTFASLTATGSSGNVITITSSTSATHTLTHVPTSIATRFVSCDWLNLSFSIASPLNNFYAGANSTDSGNNQGWIFTAPPTENIAAINGVTIANAKNINSTTPQNFYSWNGIV